MGSGVTHSHLEQSPSDQLNDPNLHIHPTLHSYWPSERRAIISYRLHLSVELKRDPSLEETVETWESCTCAQQWRRKKMAGDTQRQISEIERHKYLLSETEGHDVGFEQAAADWVRNYAAKWRDWWEEQPESCPATDY